MSFDSLPAVGDDPRRVVRLDGVHNFRDLGGYPAADGRTTKWGMLYRADGLYRLTTADVEVVRTGEELDLRGRFPFEYHPVEFHHFPVMDTTWSEQAQIEVTDRDAAEFLEWAYLDMLREGGPRFANAIVHLAEPDVLPAVFHCAAGKDRTGVLAMLILGALGVPHDYIVADYALTGEGMERLREWSRREAPELFERMASQPASFMAAVPEAMDRVITTLVAEHGSLRDLVVHLGVPVDAIAALEAHLLE
jgi:protein-tyrosine phosphatase